MKTVMVFVVLFVSSVLAETCTIDLWCSLESNILTLSSQYGSISAPAYALFDKDDTQYGPLYRNFLAKLNEHCDTTHQAEPVKCLQVTVPKQTYDLFYVQGVKLSKNDVKSVQHFMGIYGLASEFQMYYQFIIQ